jgi:mono/diheme cytochrome c family protein
MKTLTTLLAGTFVALTFYGCYSTQEATPGFGTIGGTTWTDANSNGLREATDPALGGVKVVLFDAASNTRLDSTTTSGIGTFQFENLKSILYKLRFTPPTGTVATTRTANNRADRTGFTQTIAIEGWRFDTDTLKVNRLQNAGFRAQTTYTRDVNAILTATCQPCHVEGTNPAFAARIKHVNNYANAKAAATFILDRVSRPQGAAGMMPRNGTRLSEERIATIRRWIEDGTGE